MTAALAPPPVRSGPPSPLPTLGPHAHGERFAWGDYLAALDAGDVTPGCFFELGRGILSVANVPNLWHDAIVRRARKLLERWDDAHSGRITHIGESGGVRLIVPPFDSDRHPDVAVYTTPPPYSDSRVWRVWAPELVVEVVSPGPGPPRLDSGSRRRDHEEKPGEYLAFGVGEYWVLDPNHPDRPGPSARIFTRRSSPNGGAGDVWEERWEDGVLTTDRFPGLSVPVADVLAPLPEPTPAG